MAKSKSINYGYPTIMISDQLKSLPQYILPQHLLSRLMGFLVHCQFVPFKNFLIHLIIKLYKVDMSEAIEENPEAYPDFHHFFIRHLKPELRPITKGEKEIASPADGTISQVGKITNGRILQAKGFDFSLDELLGGSSELGKHFHGGHFLTAYLAPRDYHRVHMPFKGVLKEMIFIPGKLFSVSHSTTRAVPRLFARNERVVCIFETAAGPMAVILVGAMLVASIHTTWAGQIAPSKEKTVHRWQYPNPTTAAITLDRGDELGYFTHGSTVILLFGPDHMHWLDSVKAEGSIKMGQAIGHL